MTDDVFTTIKVQIAEVAVELRNVAHDVKGAMMEIKAMASLRELEQVKGDAALRLEAVRVDHDKRLAALEDVLKWVGRIIAGSVLIALIGLVLKSGLKP